MILSQINDVLSQLRGDNNAGVTEGDGQVVDVQTQQEIINERLKRLRGERANIGMPDGARVGRAYVAPKAGAYALAGLGDLLNITSKTNWKVKHNNSPTMMCGK